MNIYNFCSKLFIILSALSFVMIFIASSLISGIIIAVLFIINIYSCLDANEMEQAEI